MVREKDAAVLTWLAKHVLGRGFTFEQAVDLFTREYQSVDAEEDARDALDRIEQRGRSVLAYRDDFMSLFDAAGLEPDEHWSRLFVRRLNAAIREKLLAKLPSHKPYRNLSLQDAGRRA